METHYDTLGLTKDSTHSEIVEAFRALVRSGNLSPDMLRAAARAYSVLGSPGARAGYDSTSCGSGGTAVATPSASSASGRKYQPRAKRAVPDSTAAASTSGGLGLSVRRLGGSLPVAASVGIVLAALLVLVALVGLAVENAQLKRHLTTLPAAHTSAKAASEGTTQGPEGAPEAHAAAPAKPEGGSVPSEDQGMELISDVSQGPVTKRAINNPWFMNESEFEKNLKSRGMTPESYDVYYGWGDSAKEVDHAVVQEVIALKGFPQDTYFGKYKSWPDGLYAVAHLDSWEDGRVTGSYEFRERGANGREDKDDAVIATGMIHSVTILDEPNRWAPRTLESVTFGPTDLIEQ